MAKTKKKKKGKKEDRSGLLVPACLLIGMGFGFITDHLVGGMFLGLGVGLLGMFIIQSKKK